MLTRKNAILLSTMVLTSLPVAARAEEAAKMDHSKMGHVHAAATAATPADAPVDVYADAMKKMHEEMMAVKPTGDADVDFVKGMIPHHQGAIDMAKVVLEKGKDPEIRKLAEEVIKAQESEIKMMNDWLKAHKK